jgi:hypothetical protein
LNSGEIFQPFTDGVHTTTAFDVFNLEYLFHDLDGLEGYSDFKEIF